MKQPKTLQSVPPSTATAITEAFLEDHDDAVFTSFTAEHIEFRGAMTRMGFDVKTGNLQITITVMPDSGVSNLDLATVQRRLLDVRLTPATRGQTATATSALRDPVRTALSDARYQRAVKSWLTDGPYDHHHDC